MNANSSQIGSRSAHHGPEFERIMVAEKARRSFGVFGLAAVGVIMAGLGGCTFMEQTDDLLQGGPEKRVDAAKQRQNNAMDRQQELTRTYRELVEQQETDEKMLREMRHLLEEQGARIAQARENQRLTEAEELQLRTRVAALTSEIGDLEFRIQAARAAEQTEVDAQLQERLQALRSEAERIESEIRALEE